MAEEKKTTKAAPKATVKKTVAKTTETKAAKTTTKAAPKAEKAATKAAPKAAAKTAKTTKAAAVKESICIQFAGKEYTTEQLVQIAKDVWEHDLQKNPADFKEVKLYVKPEEAKAYYVINETESGSFGI